MKHLLLLLVCSAMAIPRQAAAENTLAMQQVKLLDDNTLHFTVSKETGMYAYIVETSTDSLHFEYAGEIRSQAPSMIPVSYRMQLPGNGSRFVRIHKTTPDQQVLYTAVRKVQDPAEKKSIKAKPSSGTEWTNMLAESCHSE